MIWMKAFQAYFLAIKILAAMILHLEWPQWVHWIRKKINKMKKNKTNRSQVPRASLVMKEEREDHQTMKIDLHSKIVKLNSGLHTIFRSNQFISSSNGLKVGVTLLKISNAIMDSNGCSRIKLPTSVKPTVVSMDNFQITKVCRCSPYRWCLIRWEECKVITKACLTKTKCKCRTNLLSFLTMKNLWGS